MLLGQACAEKFRWEKCQHSAGTEHHFKNWLVCVCGIMQASCFVPEIVFPQSCLFVVKGTLMYVGSDLPCAITVLAVLAEPLLPCRVEVEG